jgi:hypothetical protein
LEVFGDLRENLAHFLVVMQVENFWRNESCWWLCRLWMTPWYS